MNFAIYGAGAIGAYLGAKLALAGEKVTLIARGAHFQAMQTNGVRIQSPEGDFEAWPTISDNPTAIGPVDFLFLTVKAHSLTEIAPKLGPLIGPDTCVISAQNGIPWWYFQKHGGPWDGSHLESVDPGGIISKAISPEQIVGCIVYPSVAIEQPGLLQHTEGNRFSIGELDGSSSQRCKQLSQVLVKADLKCPIRPRIRNDLWVKLMGNVAFNPLSALTRSTLVQIATHSETRTIAKAIMSEVETVARSLDIKIPITIQQRLKGATKVGHHKTSMLQDVELARPLELESIVGAIVELADKLEIAIPHTRTIYACTKLLAHTYSQKGCNV
jgi:2-dehydropantoate 2-reductase